MTKKEIGALGEDYASKILSAGGYVPICRNYVTRFGEIDLIVRHGNCIVFIEVKTRSETAIATPREWVDASKQKKIIKSAMLYLAEHPSKLTPRFDVFEVICIPEPWFRIIKNRHIVSAFECEDIYGLF